MPPIWLSMKHLASLLFLSTLVHGRYEMNQEGITWDYSCSEAKQQAIKVAWEGALELGDRAWNRFNTHTRPLVEQGELNGVAQLQINQQDPAYTQMFALDWSPEGVETIQNILLRATDLINTDPGTKTRPIKAQSGITIACPEEGGSVCPDEDIRAETQDHQENGQYTGSTMSFCPSFFTESESFAELKAAANQPLPANGQMDETQRKVRTLFQDTGYQGTDANQVYHEWTHLWWIGPTNAAYGLAQDEEYGFFECADLAWNDGCVMFNSPSVVWNADHYAWYAEYGYWVEQGFDSWQEKDKPVKLDVNPSE